MSITIRELRENEIKEWDGFQQNNIRGHYGVLSTWLGSYEAYGAKWKIIGTFDGLELVGGLGLVIFGKGPFKIVIAPYGPTLKKEYDTLADNILQYALADARKMGAFLFEVKIPYNNTHPDFFLNSLPKSILKMKEGYPFRVVGVPSLLFNIDLIQEIPYGEEWVEIMLKSFKASTRRNIKISLKNTLTFEVVHTDEDLISAYQIIEENARNNGYAVRSLHEFLPTLKAQIAAGHAMMSVVKKNKVLLGAHYGILAGKRLGYSMGGTKRIEKDYKIGHFLHWHVILEAKQMGLVAYDFTSVGVPSVMKFKSGFNPELFEFNTAYYTVFSKSKFFIFNKVFPYMKRHKKYLAKFANRFLAKRN